MDQRDDNFIIKNCIAINKKTNFKFIEVVQASEKRTIVSFFDEEESETYYCDIYYWYNYYSERITYLSDKVDLKIINSFIENNSYILIRPKYLILSNENIIYHHSLFNSIIEIVEDKIEIINSLNCCFSVINPSDFLLYDNIYYFNKIDLVLNNCNECDFCTFIMYNTIKHILSTMKKCDPEQLTLFALVILPLVFISTISLMVIFVIHNYESETIKNVDEGIKYENFGIEFCQEKWENISRKLEEIKDVIEKHDHESVLDNKFMFHYFNDRFMDINNLVKNVTFKKISGIVKYTNNTCKIPSTKIKSAYFERPDLSDLEYYLEKDKLEQNVILFNKLFNITIPETFLSSIEMLEIKQLSLKQLMISILLNETIDFVSCENSKMHTVLKFIKYHYYENVMQKLFSRVYYNIRINNKINKEYIQRYILKSGKIIDVFENANFSTNYKYILMTQFLGGDIETALYNFNMITNRYPYKIRRNLLGGKINFS